MKLRYLRDAVTMCLVFMVTLTPCLAATPKRSSVKFGIQQTPQQGQETEEEKKLREKQDKQAKQEQERKDREAKNKAKATKQYNTLHDFAEDMYATDPDFRDQVDEQYLNLKHQHAMEAYRINVTRLNAGPQRVIDSTGEESLRIERTLYDNPWVQDYVNRVGQSLVPADSDKLYAFKVVSNPIPYAYTLSTGTILISTGMVSLLDNEAQLSYVLAHELAHVYKDHWKVKVMMPMAEEEYNKRQEKKRAMWAGILGGVGAAIGGGVGGGNGALTGALVGVLAGYTIGAVYSRKLGVEWESTQENEADEFAMRTALEKSYDIKEVQKLYVALNEVSKGDDRMQLGFLGNRKRLRERSEQAQKLIDVTLQSEYQQALKSGKLVGTSADFNVVMAELKRDNGIEALNYDMFQMARQNLRQSVMLRTDDAVAAYYYARVLKLVGRTKEEKDTADQYLRTAISLDLNRQTMPGMYLQRALVLMDSKDPAMQPEAVKALQDYVLSYEKRNTIKAQEAELPPNIELIYDFMRLLGEKSWRAPTLNVNAVQISTSPKSDTVTTPPPSNTTTPPRRKP